MKIVRKAKLFNFKKSISKRNLVLTITLGSFLGAIVYMQIGGSQNTRFGITEGPIRIEGDSKYTNTTHNTDETLDPEWPTPPDIPTIPPLVDPPRPPPPSPPPPVDPPDGDRRDDDLEPPITGSHNIKNVTLGERSDKGRNLPKFEIVNLQFLNFNLLNLINLRNLLAINSIIFLSLLVMPIVVLNKIMPGWGHRLDKFDEDEDYSDSLFIIPARTLSRFNRRKERVRRLLIFKDQVGEVIERSKIRIVRKTPSHTIILGYYELDKAFSRFSALIRSKDITPLEHAHMYFETGEINNEALQQ
ncbi:MAG: hypothetical protein ACXAD7_21130, partial [Candidatus Kariarchaeaceae archaeon]